MTIIPGINCLDFECVESKISKAREFKFPTVHLDIADGVFTNFVSWNEPEKITKQLISNNLGPNIELHLMVQKPKEVLEMWRSIEVKKAIIHVDSVEREEFDLIVEHCELNNIEIVPAVTVGVSTRRILRYVDEFKFRSALILAVVPGPSGQKFNEQVLEIIRELRSKSPKLSIVVDGGINPDVALRAKEAGADTLVSTSYIWESKNPAEMFHELQIV